MLTITGSSRPRSWPELPVLGPRGANAFFEKVPHSSQAGQGRLGEFLCNQSAFPTAAFPLSPPPHFKHSPPEDTVFRGTRFHHTSAPVPRPHSPAASSQTAQYGAMALAPALGSRPAALAREKKRSANNPEGGHAEIAQRTLDQGFLRGTPTGPAPLSSTDPAPHTWPQPSKTLSPRDPERS